MLIYGICLFYLIFLSAFIYIPYVFTILFYAGKGNRNVAEITIQIGILNSNDNDEFESTMKKY